MPAPRALVSFAAAIAVFVSSLAVSHAQTGLSLTITQPDGLGDRVAAGRDFATEQLGDAWDMNELGDVDTQDSGGIAGAAVSGGVFSATTTTADPGLFLLDPGIGGTQRQGRTGKTFPIDTQTYRHLSVRMNVSVASVLQVFWYTGAQDGPFASSAFVETKPGWRVYTIDLATTAITSGSVASWAGQPASGLRIDPTAVSSSTFQIDWVRLTATGDAATSFTPAFSGVDSGSNAAINLYLDSDASFANGYVERVATGLREDAASSATLQLAKYAPGDYHVVGRLSRDYAGLMLEDAWDMSNAGDVAATGGFSSPSVSGGVFSGTTNTSDPAIQLNVPGAGPDGIDASIFRTVTFQMTLNGSSLVQVIWQTSDGQFHATALQNGSAGSNLYTFNVGSDANWAGTIRSLRIDPATSAGISVSIDWASVHTGGTLTSAPVVVVDAGDGPLSINTPPVARLLQPDASGGLDYASWARANAWNMAEASDVQLTGGLAGGFPQYLRDTTVEGVRNDYMRGQNQAGNGDPGVLFLFNDTTLPIDANRFKNLTFRMSITGPRDVGNGSVARLFWQRTTGAIQSSEDIIVDAGLNTYVFDLPALLKEPLDPNNDGTAWSGTVKYFRIDPHEFATQREFFFDSVKVTADDTANGRFAIAWSADDPDDGDATISLFYDTNRSGFDGTLIAAGLPATAADNLHVWDTHGVANGTYYLYTVVTDGINTTRRYATGRLVVDNTAPGDTTAPIGALETATTVTPSSGVVTVRGWALDDVQIASIQVLVDGTPVKRPATGLFRPDVRDASPSYADCSEAGFETTFDASTLGPGAHSLTVAVYDTAGNRRLLGGAAGGAATAGVYTPSSSTFFLKNSNGPGNADETFIYGPASSTLTPIVGDWDGDGTETVGLYDQATATFFLRNSSAPGPADVTVIYGPANAGWLPLAGDWDGDGVDTIGLFSPSGSTFFLRNVNAPGNADVVAVFGVANSGWRPIAGDWNGDGLDTIGFYAPASGTFFLRNVNAPGNADVTFIYGSPNATPLVGDWNNDGVDTIGIYQAATASWFLKNSNAPGNADISFIYGPPNATPLAGDWNGATPRD